MSRATDIVRLPPTGEPPPLPIVDWKAIGQTAPVPIIGEYDGPNAPLPKADMAVLTWTTAEWSAFDHVFVNSSTTRTQSAHEWQTSWNLYTRNAGSQGENPPGGKLWGLYRLVEMTTTGGAKLRVLLFKCDAHLAHPPWIDGLEQMVGQIADETGADWIYSIGTAGGSREDERLGDVVITNAAHLQLQQAQNLKAPINNQTFTCITFPATELLATVQQQFFRMATVATYPALENLVHQLNVKVGGGANYSLDDLLNSALDPKNLGTSNSFSMPGTPLLTTDFYLIADATSQSQWAVLEMDDAVIAYVAEQRGRKFAFVRNISDPVIPAATPQGQTIPDNVRDDWSSLIYEQFGFYTSFNGALAAWAAITAQS